ncbi:cytochrome c biogenesis CcdA family protein [Acetonema longum]|uniref:Cytochrome c biogenesis protein transmembrane region n=1 Tax=Acetonema longum DSM 6540 TaxID=1009370 RepID=F7NNJ5_9FIRM|nr:cytochrome c biogenesis protein transmembrane region [Acetonema longum DSM 6540]
MDQNVTMVTAFLAGMISFLSPCVLPMLPTYSAMLAGSGGKGEKSRFWVNAISFLLGFTLVFVFMGATASYFGALLLENQQIVRKVAGIFMTAMGIHLAGFIKIRFLAREYRPFLEQAFSGPFGAFLLGMAFTAGWTPCTGPILATILMYAGALPTLSQGALLLFVYAMGFSLPFLLLAAALQYCVFSLAGLYHALPLIQRLAGIVLILAGLAVCFDIMPAELNSLWY